ncbi:serum response factor-binding protein 1 isoform X2 [Anolis carolinensis]|uniref:serum response factor-binding protein 1 isoform X2 n=1 Tax=Anolis carolinensis TaxID=28377 RepID=UPI000462C5FA|nr:PREDICTED: serum response factor-binding protein 1 isoform X2 [Anolis carolinensis]|eukprot:XP_008112259.1 PREDICTED: serum response factor-binding protein 1 isoform X2 [Anolis carolinensis]
MRGTEEEVLKNQKRVQRLLEEIQAMKEIKPDQVTKLALGKDIDFEIICKMPNCTAKDRAIARLSAHPLLKTKIADIKAAVKAFKDARLKPSRTVSSEEHKSEEQLTKQPEETQHSSNREQNKTFKQAEHQNKIKVKEKPGTVMGKEQISVLEEQKKDTEQQCPVDDFPLQEGEHPKLAHQVQTVQTDHTICPEGEKCLGDLHSRADESDSDQSQSEESGTVKEYFDDSTEERFYNQSSDSEKSDSNDDFFIGKVKRTKKRAMADISIPREEKKGIMFKTSKSVMVQDTDTKHNSQKSKAANLDSVFYCSLSNSDKSKNVKRTSRDSLPRNKSTFEKSHPQKQKHKGLGMRRDEGKKQLEQALHPSWEASRKRREQVSQITAFQGKKIIFED